MKRTKFPYRSAALILAFAGILYACKKNNNSGSNDNGPGQTPAGLQVQADDQSRVSNENDAAANDISIIMSMPSAYGVAPAGYTPGPRSTGLINVKLPVCDAIATLDTTVNPRVLTITYSGSASCTPGRVRNGVIQVSFAAGTHWWDQGAKLTVSFQNLKITRLSDNKSITLNGTQVFTDVSGGNLPALMNGSIPSITHTVTADSMRITFDDGSQRTWSVARQRQITYNGGYILTTTGIHTDRSNTGIAEWGTNRYGNNFETLITSPLVVTSACFMRLTSGSVEILRPDITTNVTFGLDSTGKATTCPGLGNPYYLQATWKGAGGKSGSVILPY